MDGKVIWKSDMKFTGSASGSDGILVAPSISGGGDGAGFSPMELVLVGVAGCTAMDVISILEKKQQKVTAFEVLAHGDRADENPRVFNHLIVEYRVTGKHIDPAAVDRAVELSETKYCSVMAMINKTATVEIKKTIIQEE
jgi:putative redox protein